MLMRALLAVAAISTLGSIAAVEPLRSAPSPAQGATRVPRDPSAVGYLNLHKRHPDGADGAVEFNTGYTTSEALQRLIQIQGFLASFARLTARVKDRIPPADLAAAGNTGADMETIGFHNIPLVVEGTLLKQDYQLKQAEYELARLKRARGDIDDRELERARRVYADATKRFQDFWDKKLPTD
jgi:hypothetical protein